MTIDQAIQIAAQEIEATIEEKAEALALLEATPYHSNYAEDLIADNPELIGK